jgi:hypothetical protein
MNKYYVIREWDGVGSWDIPREELIDRLDLAFREGFCTLTKEMDWDKVIDILLHEQPKDKPKTAHCPKCGKALTRCKCGHGEKEQPEPQPAEWPTVSVPHEKFKALQEAMPDEWEEWVERMPVTLDGKLNIFDTHEFREWFRTIPCRRKP